jgi:hypothetical protein
MRNGIKKMIAAINEKKPYRKYARKEKNQRHA